MVEEAFEDRAVVTQRRSWNHFEINVRDDIKYLGIARLNLLQVATVAFISCKTMKLEGI